MEWLKESGYGGIMVWSVDMDDFGGRCGSGKFPLLTALNNELEGYKVELEYDGPYESYNPRGKYTTKDRKSIEIKAHSSCFINALNFQRTKLLARIRTVTSATIPISLTAHITTCAKENASITCHVQHSWCSTSMRTFAIGPRTSKAVTIIHR